MKKLTESQVRALNILKDSGPLRPREFSKRMWPDSKGHRRVHNVGNGAARGVGMWLAGGGYLGKLSRAGYATRRHKRIGGRVYDYGYELTKKGREALNDEG